MKKNKNLKIFYFQEYKKQMKRTVMIVNQIKNK